MISSSPNVVPISLLGNNMSLVNTIPDLNTNSNTNNNNNISANPITTF